MTCSCPANHYTTIDRPNGGLPKEQAIAHAERLVEALNALSAEDKHTTDFDGSLLVAFVKRAKSRPGLQGRDQEIFRNGLALAIEHAP